MIADTVIVGAHVRTMDPTAPAAEAVAIRRDIIVAVGTNDEIQGHCNQRTEILDLRGGTLVPGLTDCHMHPLWSTTFAVGVDASKCANRAALSAALHAERRRIGPGAVVRVWGVQYEFFGDELDGSDLERLASGPALAVFADLHTYLATPSVLSLAGITGAEPFSDSSEIVMRDGRLTGELREFSAFWRVTHRLPGEDAAGRRRRLISLLTELNACGLTGAHVMDGDPASYETLRDLESTGELTLRMVVPLWVQPGTDEATVRKYLSMRDERGLLWRGGAAKFFIDGVIESGTAWLEEPDSLGGGQKPFWPSEEQFALTVRRFARSGFQCATHAIGDRAVRAALDAYRAAGPPPKGRHRIEHLETLPDGLLLRLADEGVAASMQPLHMQWRAADGSDTWARRLGPERAARAFRAGDVQRSGALVGLGSDWPVAGFDPRFGMAWARLRREPGRRDRQALEPEQAMDGLAALTSYTEVPAKIVGDGLRRGRIAVGMDADLTGFAADPVELDADALPELPILLTVVAGRAVYRDAAL